MALTEDEGMVLAALREAGVPAPERFRTHLADLHREYYCTADDFKRATREGLATAGLPVALVDSVLEWKAGNARTGAPRALVLRGVGCCCGPDLEGEATPFTRIQA